MENPDQNQNEKYQEVLLTHIELHSNHAVNPQSINRQVAKSLKNCKPGMAHGGRITKIEGNRFEMVLPLQDEQVLPNGKKIKYIYPAGGVPIYFGKDAIEKINALRRKGLIK